MTERYLTGVWLFAQGVLTNLGILHEAGHPEPWIIAMDCAPARAGVLDYAARWAIEPMFSDFKRGLRRLKRCLQNGIPLPTFQVVMRN